MKRRSPLWWTLAAGGAVAVVIAAVFIGRWLSTPVTVAGPTATEDELRFELFSRECGLASLTVSSAPALSPENGTFCVVKAEMRNLEDEPRELEASCQYLIDRSGTPHSPREDIAGLPEVAGDVFGQGLGPHGVTPPYFALYYDVPEGTESSAVEFHASCGSRGVRIEQPA